MLNIVVPMAGRGSRFASAGFEMPKPLIDVDGVAMIELVISNIRPTTPHRFIFLCLEEHLERYPTEEILRRQAPHCEIVTVAGVTQGAACTALLAKAFIDNDHGLMIANSDQWIDCEIDHYLAAMNRQESDGLIMTMTASDPKWSYIRVDDQGLVREVVEKQVISSEATVGIYNFRTGRDFVMAAEQMIEADLRVNGEFYIAPVYNQLIADGRRIGFVNVGSEGQGMYGLGIPADLALFRSLDVFPRAVATAKACREPSRAA